MSLTLEELRRRVVAIPGDLLLCPECREPLLRFSGTGFTGAAFLPAARPEPDGDRFKLYCHCGGGALRLISTAGPNVEDLVRSGSWTGWRALGGE